tara:strand:+ start:18150 stop:18740 length:591 start_codon:yes stop_codon:yes gene_type:complete
MTDAIHFATCQPAVNYTGTRQLGLGGCNVDENSLLRLTDMSRDKCRTSLWQRPFTTVPYLGRGRSDNLTESNLRRGEEAGISRSSKSEHPSSEISYMRYTTTPLIPQLKEDAGNSSRKIEEDAATGWIRGGLPSREYDRRTSYHSTADSRRVGSAIDVAKPWCGDSRATSNDLRAKYYASKEKALKHAAEHTYSAF